jgi:hypothetical protein
MGRILPLISFDPQIKVANVDHDTPTVTYAEQFMISSHIVDLPLAQ